MARIAPQQVESLTAAIRAHDHLRRIVGEIERLHRVVFHTTANADWSLVRLSAEQILVAELVSRYQGQIDGVYAALRRAEEAGRSWDAAIANMAAGIHSYYTTPLGIVMRQELFGDDAVFITPDAYEWTDQIRPADSSDES